MEVKKQKQLNRHWVNISSISRYKKKTHSVGMLLPDAKALFSAGKHLNVVDKMGCYNQSWNLCAISLPSVTSV